jgi:antitoxin MazE
LQTRVQKWGNSLAVRIPKAFADAVNLEPDTLVDVSVQDGSLVVAPICPTYTLEELLSQVTEQNLHPEQEIGPAVGREAWK